MKKFGKFLAVCVFIFSAVSTSFAGTKLLIAGCNWNKIALIDKEKQEILFVYEIPNYAECNSAVLLKDKKLLYTNKRNLRIADPKTSEILFEMKSENGEEFHTADILKDGKILVGICGNPSRILEMLPSGKILKEVKFETGTDTPHMQFRKITKNKRGNYYVGLFAGRKLLEVSASGEILNSVKIEMSAFAVKELKDGSVMVSGDGGKIHIINPKTGEILRRIDNSVLKEEGVQLLFATEAQMLKNGNILATNWNGHSQDKSQPKILEISPSNKVVWRLEKDTGIDNISSIQIVK